MISKSTVLVIGAGGSAAFGLPTGPRLKQQIIRYLDPTLNNQPSVIKRIPREERSKELNNGKAVYDAVASVITETVDKSTGAPVNEIIQQQLLSFVGKFRFSGQPTIDAFLEKRPDLAHTGKAAIAACLLLQQDRQKLFSGAVGDYQPNWYEYLFYRLSEYAISEDDFRQNRVKVVTFNYDNSLEYFLQVALENTYDLSSRNAVKLRESAIPICHVYGMLTPKAHFEAPLNAESVPSAVENIVVINNGEFSERDGSSEEFTRAREWLNNCERIVFVGFGFDPTNLKRLGLEKIPTHRKIYCTTHGLNDQVIETRVKAPLLPLVISDTSLHLDSKKDVVPQALENLGALD